MIRRARLLLALVGVLVAGSAHGAELDDYFGAFVGFAELEDLRSGETGQRDVDIVIEPFDSGGFRIHWVSVTLIDGRRDVPGVRRHLQTVLFEPASGQSFFIESAENNLFRERQETRPMLGDPVRWASLDDQGLHVYSFLVLEDGLYELQIYDRVLTEDGLDIEFRRILDGELVRRVTGHTVRADNIGPDSD